jgi:hypothetical protein
MSMHVRETLILNFGPRTLSRVYCENCKEETLHVRDVCNHCRPQPNGSATAVRKGIRRRAAEAQSPWRADHDATCKIRMNVRHKDD